MTGTIQVQTFSVYSGEIAAWNSGGAASWVTIPMVAEGSLELTMGEAQVTDGEGRINFQWYHSQRATVRLRVKQYFMRILEMISGNAVSSAAGAERLEFGTDAELTPPIVRLRLKARARDVTTEGTGYFHIIAYKAKGSISAPPMSETTPGEMTYTFTLLKSLKDAAGATLPGNGSFGYVSAVEST